MRLKDTITTVMKKNRAFLGSDIGKKITNVIGWFFLVSGLLVMLVCYYVLFFTTAPASYLAPPGYNPQPEKNDFRVTVFSDWMLASGVADKIAADVERKDSDFVLLLGDFCHPAQPSVMKMTVSILEKEFRRPVYATPGNHDVYDQESTAAFEAVFGSVNNCFAYGDTLFILLETAKKSITEKQFEFLKFVLAHERPKYRRCIVATHVPPMVLPKFDTSKYRLPPEDAVKLMNILDEGKVDLLICGHLHHELNLNFGKTKLLVLPHAGQGSRNPDNKRIGSLQLHFKDSGEIEHEFVYYETEFKKNNAQYFFYRRLNQRSIFFALGCFFNLCGIIMICVSGKR